MIELRPRRRARRTGAALTAALLLSLGAGCGDGSDDGTAAALPLGERDARAVAEAALADRPHLALRPQHLCIVHLEAAGGADGDTGAADGMDAIAYQFDVPTALTLAVDGGTHRLDRLVLRDPGGRPVLDVAAGEEATVAVAPGRHVLELHHAQAADATAPPQVIFLRPTRAGAPAAAARTGRAAQVAADVARIEAGADCTGCDFSNSDLTGMQFDGLDLSDCILRDATLSRASFVCATMPRCQLQTSGSGPPPMQVDTIFDGADLIGARFDGMRLFGTSFASATCLGRETPARLDGTTWNAARFGPALLGGIDFSGSSLVGAQFVEAVITQSHFDRADLSDAVFSIQGSALRFPGALLVGTDMRGASLSDDTTFAGATLADVDMAGATFGTTSFVGATLSGALFAGASLRGTNFSGTDFAGVDLSQADLSGAVLSADTSFAGATLSNGVDHGVNLACDAATLRGGCLLSSQPAQFAGADLSYATLTDANLEAADLGGATLNGAQLVGANLNLSNLRGATLRGALLGVAPGSGRKATTLRAAFMVDVDLTDADLRSADLSNAHLYGDAQRTRLVGTQLDSAVLVGAICSGATFATASLTDASFDQAQLVNTIFDGADLTNAKFDSAYLQGADFSTAAAVAGVSLSNAAVATTAGSWTYTEQDGTPSTFMFGPTALGAIAVEPDVTCPNDAPGPCNAPATLMPVDMGPFPPVPPCIPSARFCWENCLPAFDCQANCSAWTCGATCTSCGS